MSYRDIWPFWYLGTKMVDFWSPLQTRETPPVGVKRLAREGNLDILAPAWLLSCHLGTSLAAQLAPA